MSFPTCLDAHLSVLQNESEPRRDTHAFKYWLWYYGNAAASRVMVELDGKLVLILGPSGHAFCWQPDNLNLKVNRNVNITLRIIVMHGRVA